MGKTIVKLPKLVRPPKSQKKQAAMTRNIKMTAWIVALKENDFLVHGTNFKHIPKKGTPEHEAIVKRKQELIAEWEALGHIPQEYQKESKQQETPDEEVATAEAQPSLDQQVQVAPRKRKPSNKIRTLAYIGALRLMGFLQNGDYNDLPVRVRDIERTKKIQERYLNNWSLSNGVFPDGCDVTNIPKPPKGVIFTENGLVPRPQRTKKGAAISAVDVEMKDAMETAPAAPAAADPVISPAEVTVSA